MVQSNSYFIGRLSETLHVCEHMGPILRTLLGMLIPCSVPAYTEPLTQYLQDHRRPATDQRAAQLSSRPATSACMLCA